MGVVFVGGNLALDFVGTLNERDTRRVEQLRTPADLASWVVRAGVVDVTPQVTDDDLAQAVRLREGLFRVIRAIIDGRSLPRPSLATLNEAAAGQPPVLRVTVGGAVRRTGDLSACLTAVARDAVELFERGDEAVLKWCADPHCTHPFLDRSRGARRRWCEMAGCGDRAKAAAYRARIRQGRSVPVYRETAPQK